MAFECGLTDEASCGYGVGRVLDQFTKRNCETVGTGAVELLAAESPHQGRYIRYVYRGISRLPTLGLDILGEFDRVACAGRAGEESARRSAGSTENCIALLEFPVQLVDEIECHPPCRCFGFRKRSCGCDDQLCRAVVVVGQVAEMVLSRPVGIGHRVHLEDLEEKGRCPRSVRRRKVRAAKLIADGLWVDLRRGKYDPIRQLRVGTPDADHVSCLPAGPTLAFAAGLAGVGSPRAPGSSRQRCGRCTGLDGVLCALRGGRSTQRPLRAVDDGQGADLCLRDGHILLARGGEEAGGGCSISDARGGQLPATSHGM